MSWSINEPLLSYDAILNPDIGCWDLGFYMPETTNVTLVSPAIDVFVRLIVKVLFANVHGSTVVLSLHYTFDGTLRSLGN